MLQRDPVGTVLPELAVGLVLLQLKLPLLMLRVACLPQLLSVLVDHLDKVNRSALGAHREDEEDLSWPGVKSMLCAVSMGRSSGWGCYYVVRPSGIAIGKVWRLLGPWYRVW